MTYTHPVCEVLPLPDRQAAFLVAGQERVRWHFSDIYPRPFFYPFAGPSGRSLTRMGHPGAANHDHHRSIWFAHDQVLGHSFWSDQTDTRIRQKQWLAYQDGKNEAVLAVRLGWYGGPESRELLEQELIAAVRPEEHGETLLELQSTFRPTADALEFGQTNFGFLAVRVAKSLSAYFGGGRLTNSEGLVGEEAIFGKPARWMDYSGPVPLFHNGELRSVDEGITYCDHPGNPRYPAHWHVRSDGWMGASVCLQAPLAITKDAPLVLRYLLHAHRGPLDAHRAEILSAHFAASSPYQVAKAEVPHLEHIVQRTSS